jgi:hypothetical protein
MSYRFIAALGLCIACAACSQKQEQAEAPAPAKSATSAGPALAISDTNPGGITYFNELLQHQDFASAFEALSNADQLPLWTHQGGTSTPAQQVEIEGRTQVLAIACKPHDCPTERILVLYDVNTHAMSGLFARRKAGAANDVDSNDPANDDLIWLGAPDKAAKALLQQKLYSPD